MSFPHPFPRLSHPAQPPCSETSAGEANSSGYGLCCLGREQPVLLADAAPAPWSRIEIGERFPSLTYFCKASLLQPPALVSELVCKPPSKAGEHAGGHGGKKSEWEVARRVPFPWKDN